MGRNSLVLIYQDALVDRIFKLLREERSDVADEYHMRDARELADYLIQPSF